MVKTIHSQDRSLTEYSWSDSIFKILMLIFLQQYPQPNTEQLRDDRRHIFKHSGGLKFSEALLLSSLIEITN